MDKKSKLQMETMYLKGLIMNQKGERDKLLKESKLHVCVSVHACMLWKKKLERIWRSKRNKYSSVKQ